MSLANNVFIVESIFTRTHANKFTIFITNKNQNLTFSQQMEKLILEQIHSAIKRLFVKLQGHRVKLLLIQIFGIVFMVIFWLLCKNSSGITQGISIVSQKSILYSPYVLCLQALFFFYCLFYFKQAGNVSFLHKLLLKVCIVHIFRNHKMFMSQDTE